MTIAATRTETVHFSSALTSHGATGGAAPTETVPVSPALTTPGVAEECEGRPLPHIDDSADAPVHGRTSVLPEGSVNGKALVDNGIRTIVQEPCLALDKKQEDRTFDTASSRRIHTEEETPIFETPIFEVGERVLVGRKAVKGIVRFVGSTEFDAGTWLGIELTNALGKNNGSIHGVQYFVYGPRSCRSKCEGTCTCMYGIFVRPTAVRAAVQAKEHLAPPTDLTKQHLKKATAATDCLASKRTSVEAGHNLNNKIAIARFQVAFLEKLILSSVATIQAAPMTRIAKLDLELAYLVIADLKLQKLRWEAVSRDLENVRSSPDYTPDWAVERVKSIWKFVDLDNATDSPTEDVDGDGFIFDTPTDEVPFCDMDVDGDGFISRTELTQAHKDGRFVLSEQSLEIADNADAIDYFFVLYDKDGDGMLTKTDLQQASNEGLILFMGPSRSSALSCKSLAKPSPLSCKSLAVNSTRVASTPCKSLAVNSTRVTSTRMLTLSPKSLSATPSATSGTRRLYESIAGDGVGITMSKLEAALDSGELMAGQTKTSRNSHSRFLNAAESLGSFDEFSKKSIKNSNIAKATPEASMKHSLTVKTLLGTANIADGYLSKEDLELGVKRGSVIVSSGLAPKGKDDATALFECIDVDRDGKVSADELELAVSHGLLRIAETP